MKNKNKLIENSNKLIENSNAIFALGEREPISSLLKKHADLIVTR